MLYRQGAMNLIVNAHPDAAGADAATPAVGAIALRVRDAGYACQHALDLGAWDMPTRASAMELNIPGIHGVGDSLIYFVDRYRDFSIYDVDFVPLPGVEPQPAGGRRAALVRRRADDLRRPHAPTGSTSTASLFGFSVLPGGQYFGVLPKGTLLESPCHKFYLQLIEPPPGAEDIDWDERLVRVGLGAPDVPAAVQRAAGARHRVRRPRCGPAERQGRADADLSRRRDFRAGREPPEGMNRRHMNLDHFGMDTITLAGPLEAKLRAMRAAGFTQVMLTRATSSAIPAARPAHRGGARERPARHRIPGAARLRGPVRPPARLQGRRREGDARDVPRARLEGAARVLVDSAARDAAIATPRERPAEARDAGGAARHPRRVRGAVLGPPRQRVPAGLGHRRSEADRANLGLGLDSFHISPPRPTLELLEEIDPRQDLPGAALRLHVAGSPLAGGAHQHGAPLPRLPRRRRAQRQGRRDWCASSTRWATAATTASRCSTTTTAAARCRWSPSARGAR